MSSPSASSASAWETSQHDTQLAQQNSNTSDSQEPGSWAHEHSEEEMHNCISCGTPSKALRQLSCGHLWGRGCLSARIELALRWEGNWPAGCCQKIDDEEIRALAPFLEEKVVQRYLDRYQEMETPRDRRIYCANRLCSAFLGQQGIAGHMEACIKCNALTCLACGQDAELHDHDECPPGTTTASHEELIQSGELQQCPGCPEVVELRDACNHITCLCGTEFCFACGAFWRTCFCPLYPGGEQGADEMREEEEWNAEAEQAFAPARATCLHPIFNIATSRARCEYCGHSSNRRMYKCSRCRTPVCYDCYDRLNLYLIGAAALRQEAALMRAESAGG